MTKSLLTISMLLLFSHSLTAGEVCHKLWEPMTKPGETVQDGFILKSNYENTKVTSVDIRKASDSEIRKVKLPRSADQVWNFDFLGDNLIYKVGDELFFLNTKTNEEVKLPIKAENSGYSNTTFGRGSNLGMLFLNNQSRLVINGENGRSVLVPGGNESYPQVKKNTLVYKKNATTWTFADLGKQNSSFDIPTSAGANVMMNHDEVIEIHYPNEDAKKDAFIKKNNKWVKASEKENSLFSAIMPNGQLAYLKYTAKNGDKNLKPNSSNINQFNISTDIYDQKGQKVKTLNKALFSYQKGVFTEIDFQSVPLRMHVFTERDAERLIKGENVPPVYSQDSGVTGFTSTENWISAPQNGKTTLINIKTNAKIEVPGIVANLEENQDGSKLILNRGNSGSYHRSVLDIKTKKELSLGNDYVNSDRSFKTFYKYEGAIVTPVRRCFNDAIQVISDDCNCQGKGTDFDSNFSKENFSELQKVALETLCQAPTFSSTDWDSITPPITKGSISEKQALLYLKRFQKKDGYNSKFLPVLYSILKSPIVEKQPKQIENALQVLAAADPSLTNFLMSEFKLASKLRKKVDNADTKRCEGPETTAIRQSTVQNLISNAQQSTVQPSDIKKWQPLALFQDAMKEIPEEKKQAMIDNITESLSQKAALDQDLSGTFQSKLYYFSKKFAMDLFGKEPKPATDLTIAVNSGKQAPIILSSSEVKGVDGQSSLPQIEALVPEDKNKYGFHYKRLADLSLPEKAPVGSVQTRDYSWETANGKYTAKAELKVLEPLGELIGKEAAPPYKAMKSDGKLVGAMVIGSNLSSHAGLTDHYISYYQNEGYEFGEPKEVSTVQFLKQEVQSGNLDYMIKEAHSDGDENNLFRATKKSTLLEGKRKKQDGTVETIYLLGPVANSHDSELISNQDFGSWLRQRKETQPFVYFNTSCSSTRKVIAEIGAAHSKNFIPYPSVATVHTFSDRDDNPMKVMLDSFLKEKSYEDIRTEMKKTPMYQNGSDRMLFPDEPDYDKMIRSNLKMNLDTKITVKDSKGKVLNIDEQIDH